VLTIIDPRTVVTTVLPWRRPTICRSFGALAEFAIALIATAVVFPIVFSISGAYRGRGNALVRVGGPMLPRPPA
jgi:hypothetical protein